MSDRTREAIDDSEDFAATHNSTRWMGEWDAWLHIYDQLPVVTRAALAHLHGRHDELTMHCPLCVDEPVRRFASLTSEGFQFRWCEEHLFGGQIDSVHPCEYFAEDDPDQYPCRFVVLRSVEEDET